MPCMEWLLMMNGEYEDGVGVLGVLVSLLVYGFGLVYGLGG